MANTDRLAADFTLDEAACRDGTAVPQELYQAVKRHAGYLQILRNEIRRPIKVLSWYRTKSHNRKVGGARSSLHMKGIATDIQVVGILPSTLRTVVLRLIDQKRIPQGGVGLYDTFLHYDSRGTKARWTSHAHKESK